MRGNRGQRSDFDPRVEPEPRLARRKVEGAPSFNDVRNRWELIICPECGTDLPDMSSVRIRRTGQDYEARCQTCGAIAARFVAGVWSS